MNNKLDTDLISLRSFIAVVEEQSFSAAANRVGRTQAAVSLQVSKLEERLGVKLLNRDSRSVNLTDEGKVFISYARKIIATSDEALLALLNSSKANLRVGFGEFLAPSNLYEIIQNFKAQYPNCDVSLNLGLGDNLVESLKQGDLDLVFAGPWIGNYNNGKILWEEQLVWTGNSYDKDNLDLVLIKEPCSFRKAALNALDNDNKDYKIVIQTSSLSAVQSAVSANAGISVVPKSAVINNMNIIEGELPGLPSIAVMCYENKEHNNIYSKNFIEFLKSNLDNSVNIIS